MNTSTQIYVTENDAKRLEALLSNAKQSSSSLEAELVRATVMAQHEIPKGVVTMNSRVRFQDELTGEQSEVELVYPEDANIAEGKISVFAPVGTALLGLREGDSIEWPVPSGKQRALTVVSVLFQPEAEGRYDL